MSVGRTPDGVRPSVCRVRRCLVTSPSVTALPLLHRVCIRVTFRPSADNYCKNFTVVISILSALTSRHSTTPQTAKNQRKTEGALRLPQHTPGPTGKNFAVNFPAFLSVHRTPRALTQHAPPTARSPNLHLTHRPAHAQRSASFLAHTHTGQTGRRRTRRGSASPLTPPAYTRGAHPTKAPHEALRQSLLNCSSPQTKEVLRPREHPGEEDRDGEGRDNHRFNDFEPGGAGQVAEKPSVHEKNPLDSLRRRALEPAQREHPWTSESTNQRSGGRCSARNCRIPGCRSSSS